MPGDVAALARKIAIKRHQIEYGEFSHVPHLLQSIRCRMQRPQFNYDIKGRKDVSLRPLIVHCCFSGHSTHAGKLTTTESSLIQNGLEFLKTEISIVKHDPGQFSP